MLQNIKKILLRVLIFDSIFILGAVLFILISKKNPIFILHFIVGNAAGVINLFFLLKNNSEVKDNPDSGSKIVFKSYAFRIITLFAVLIILIKIVNFDILYTLAGLLGVQFSVYGSQISLIRELDKEK